MLLKMLGNIQQPGGGGGSLDAAYDYGGAGAGRQITVDTNPIELLTANATTLRLGNTSSEGGDFEVYRDASGTLAVKIDADGNPVIAIRSASNNEILRITNGSQNLSMGISTVTGQGATEFCKIMYGTSCGIAISDQFGDAMIIFGDSEGDRIKIDPANRYIRGDSDVMGFSVSTASLTLGSLGSVGLPVKTTAGAPNDAAGGNLDGCIVFNTNDNKIYIRSGGSWVASAALS